MQSSFGHASEPSPCAERSCGGLLEKSGARRSAPDRWADQSIYEGGAVVAPFPLPPLSASRSEAMFVPQLEQNLASSAFQAPQGQRCVSFSSAVDAPLPRTAVPHWSQYAESASFIE